MPPSKFRSLSLLLLAEIAAMSLWFVSSAILPDMIQEADISSARQAALSSGVQAGFVVGALCVSFFGLADRYDPRRLFAICAILAGLSNITLILIAPGSFTAIFARFLTGALLAGVYPVGMKIAVGWGKKDRGFLVGALVAALTLGSASPHLLSLLGGAEWRITVVGTSLAAAFGGVICLFVTLGPHHAIAPRFDPKTIALAWTNRRVRLAYAGYLGHMWELYAMWAWIGLATATSYAATMPMEEAIRLSTITAFCAIAAGAIACVFAGYVADRIGKAEVATISMILSGTSALLAAITFGGPAWITLVIVIIWGITVIPDSAQFSALVADHSLPEQAGSLMTFQTALGFALTIVTVQMTPMFANLFGWPVVLAGLALGPLFGIVAMLRLRRIT